MSFQVRTEKTIHIKHAPHYDKAKKLHHHNWKVEVEIWGPAETKGNPQVDWKIIDRIITGYHDRNLTKLMGPRSEIERFTARLMRDIISFCALCQSKWSDVIVRVWQNKREYVELTRKTRRRFR